MLEYIILGGAVFLIAKLSRVDRAGIISARQAAAYNISDKGGINERAMRNRMSRYGTHDFFTNIDSTGSGNFGKLNIDTTNKSHLGAMTKMMNINEAETQKQCAMRAKSFFKSSDCILVGWGDRPKEIINTVSNN